MYFGHLPAGYMSVLAIRKLFRKKDITNTRPQYLVLIGLIASILPDFDMFYFYLVDNCQHLHHSYLTHIPFYWFCLWMLWFLSSLLVRQIKFGIYGIIVMTNITVHLMLDTINAGIKWFYPVSQKYIVFIHVPATHRLTIMNFVTHWSFVFEVVIVLSALYMYISAFAMNQKQVDLKKNPV